ncbi:TetR/AcrR family transcriptional regulator [Halococcoides cellulosivorans]|uniref:TetR/AcrR family transcriptional regulator n=1 Tax=Halococcoides cellulosivorans TaxID=1679096 RepID=UPI00131EF076|nr:TetR/AcrR family transcriptional regulator [Halococcoides cellulosivorans]
MSGFSDEDRERIRTELLEAGRQQLLDLGPDRTRVVDITEPVGIAKPTFYQFFDSKAEIYLEICTREIETFTDDLAADLATMDDPRAEFEQFVRARVRFLEENPYVHRVLAEGHPRDVLGSVSQDRADRARAAVVADLVPIVEDIQRRAEGPITEMDPVTVCRLMKPLVLLVIDQQEHPRDDYEEIRDLSIEMLARGLVENG